MCCMTKWFCQFPMITRNCLAKRFVPCFVKRREIFYNYTHEHWTWNNQCSRHSIVPMLGGVNMRAIISVSFNEWLNRDCFEPNDCEIIYQNDLQNQNSIFSVNGNDYLMPSAALKLNAVLFALMAHRLAYNGRGIKKVNDCKQWELVVHGAQQNAKINNNKIPSIRCAYVGFPRNAPIRCVYD